MSHYFISDLHLSPEQPETVDYFFQFIKQHKHDMESLTLLGDFFEVWIGDDSLDDWSRQLFLAIQNTNAKVRFIAGNRDFLLSDSLLKQFNIKLLPDNSKITLNGIAVLLAHGDQLCTDDIKYQEFRALVRSDAWQQDFLSKPLNERQIMVQALREQSKQAMKDKHEDIMDVNALAVEQAFIDYDVSLIIHGHTHREALHRYENNKNRFVLGAWHDGISYIKADIDNDALNLVLYPSKESLCLS